MKKALLFIFTLIIFSNNVYAAKKINVTFNGCIDGDTAKVMLNKKIIKIRFLAIDTPETKHPTKGVEPYGKDASNYTCKMLKTAKNIAIEYDDNSDKLDKYNRHLVWVFVNNELLQDKLIEKGLAKVAYLYGDYKYTYILENTQINAQKEKMGIWSNQTSNYSTLSIIILVILLTLFLMFNQKFRRKFTNKLKRKMKKKLNNLLKN